MKLIPISAAMFALVLSASAASAQSAAPAAGSNDAVPEKTAPGTAPATNLDTKSGTLSDKLSDTKGVIKPTTDVDPAMHVPAPKTGNMPVITPGETGNGTAK